MKKSIYTLAFACLAVSSFGQNANTYGMLANPTNLLLNPGADPISNFHLGLGHINQSLDLGVSAGDVFGGSDGVLGNLSNTDLETLSFSSETSIDAMSLGLKVGKSYLFAGTRFDIFSSNSIDMDLVRFGYAGMVDANGDFDVNYLGDFSSTAVSLDVVANVYVGLQRAFLDNKLRIGATYNQSRYVAGARVNTNDFFIQSSPQSNGLNQVAVGYDFEIQTANLLEEGSTVAEVQELANYLVTDPAKAQTFLLSPVAVANTFGFGIGFKPIRQLELQFSMNGLGASGFDNIGARSHSFGNEDTFSGMDYVSSTGDSLASSIQDSLSSFLDQVTNFADQTLTETSSSFNASIPQNTNAAMMVYLGKRSYIGAHYTRRTNSIRDYEYLGGNIYWWAGKELQIKAGYYTSLDNTNLDFMTASLQFRFTPFIQVFVGTRSVMDLATITDAFFASSSDLPTFVKNPVVPASMNGVQINAGVSMAFYDHRFKEERMERKEKKAAKKAAEVVSPEVLTPADAERVDRAYDNSKVVEEVKK